MLVSAKTTTFTPTRSTFTASSTRTPARCSRLVRRLVSQLCVPPTYSSRITDFPAHRTNPAKPEDLSSNTVPHSVAGDSLADSGRTRIPPPMEASDYLPELVARKAVEEGKTWDVRRDLKPLHVLQPQGVSFSMDGNCIHWQGWSMHIGFKSVFFQINYIDCMLMLAPNTATAKASSSPPSSTSTGTRAACAPCSTAPRSPRWSSRTPRPSGRTLGSSRLMLASTVSA